MKTTTAIFLITVVLVIGTVLLKNRVEDAVPEDIFSNPNIIANQLCYIYNSEAGDTLLLSMDIREDQVLGELYYLPYEKDSKIGVFRGAVVGREVNSIWKVEAEGMEAEEELKISFDDNNASPAFGEMVEGENGVYMYKDYSNLSYPFNLQRTDCGDDALD